MAVYPGAAATDANLYIAVNALQNNLSAAINASVTTIGLNSAVGFPTFGTVLIDSEVIQYTGISGANLTGCTRGFDGTAGASHSSAATVSHAIVADHHNVIKNEVEAVESDLITKFGAGTPRLTIAAGGTNSSSALGNGKAMVSSAGKIIEDTLGIISGTISAVVAFITNTVNPSLTGLIRLATSDSISWRNFNNNADLPLAKNSSDTLTYNGNAFLPSTGIVPVAAGGTNSSTALANGKAITSSAGKIVEGVNGVNAAGYIIGTIVQTIQFTTTTTTTTTSSTFGVTSLTANITPLATTHKIKITAKGSMQVGAGRVTYATIERNAVNLAGANGFAQTSSTATIGITSEGTMVFLDSPASVSAQTYAVYVRNDDNATSTAWGFGADTQVLLLEEIAN
jgi:hypothetical protein